MLMSKEWDKMKMVEDLEIGKVMRWSREEAG